MEILTTVRIYRRIGLTTARPISLPNLNASTQFTIKELPKTQLKTTPQTPSQSCLTLLQTPPIPLQNPPQTPLQTPLQAPNKSRKTRDALYGIRTSKAENSRQDN